MQHAFLSALCLAASLLITPAWAETPSASPGDATPPTDGATPDPRQAELDFWTSIKDSKKAEDYQAYLDKYPAGDFADLARLRLKKYGAPAGSASRSAAPSGADPRLAEIDYWNGIRNSNNIQDYYAYLDKYPNGEFAELAHDRIQQMTAAAAPAPVLLVAPPAPPAAEPASVTPTPEKAPAKEPEKKPEAAKPAEPPAGATPSPAPSVTFSAADATVYAKGGGQVRVEPDAKTKLLTKLKANTKVHATGKSTDGRWWRVEIAGGKTGYMHKSVVSEKALQATPGDNAAAAAPAPADQETCKPDSDVTANARVAACERVLEKAGSDDKAKLAALKDLAAALNGAGRNDDAIRKYEQAAELAPREGWIYDRLGLVRLDQLKFAEARAAFEKAAALDPQNPDIVFHRGLAYTGIGDFEQARLEVKRALLTKDDPAYYEKLAEIEITRGDLDAAKTALERGRKLDSWRHSLVLLATNYFIGAMDHAEGQGAVVPDDTNAALWNALLRKARGDKEGATQILKSTRQEIGKRDWPGPVFDALMGKLSATKARAAAKAKPSTLEFQRLCKLNFFLGEWAYLSGDNEAARDFLQAAVDTRAYYMLEYSAAKARLARLGG